MTTTTTHTEPAGAGAAVPAWRTLATRVLSALAALVVGLAFFSLPLLVLSWFSSGEETIHAVHGIGWGVAGGLLLAGGLTGLAFAPRRVAALQQVLAAVLGLVVGVAVADPSGLGEALPFVVVAGLLVWLSPARAGLTDLAPRSRILLAITLVAAVPLAYYAWDQAALSRGAAPTDPHVAEENHYASMAEMSIALVLTGLVAAAKRPGWRLPLWCAGVGTLLLGLSSLFLGTAGSLAPAWAVLAVVGGAAFIAVGELEARRPGAWRER